MRKLMKYQLWPMLKKVVVKLCQMFSMNLTNLINFTEVTVQFVNIWPKRCHVVCRSNDQGITDTPHLEPRGHDLERVARVEHGLVEGLEQPACATSC